PKNWMEFHERDFRELKVGIGNVIALADYMIVNEVSIGEFKRKAGELLMRLVENA
ncbi:MAG: dephospho-CoA kinase, partial [Candidatus Methanomethylicota archaeon]